LSISHIAVVQVPVSSLQRALHFYQDALGLTPSAESKTTSGAPAFALFDFGTARSSLHLQEEQETQYTGQGNMIMLEVKPGTDVGSLLERVINSDGTIRYREVSGDWLRIGLADPDQNFLELLVPR